MGFKDFLYKGGVFSAILKMIVSVVLFVILLNFIFSIYTMHGRTKTVPDVEGMTLKKAKKAIRKESLEYVIADSSFKSDIPPGTILDQTPDGGASVKKYRKVYLTVNSYTPPMLKMPNLIDNSRRQAIIILQSYGLKLGKETYVPDMAKDAVRAMRFKGKEIKEGFLLPKGSIVDLDLGDGVGDQDVEVPDLIGGTLIEALAVLDAYGLQPGIISADGYIADSLSAFIYYQQPEFGTAYKLKPGDPVNLFIMQEKPDIENLPGTENVKEVDPAELEKLNNDKKKDPNNNNIGGN